MTTISVPLTAELLNKLEELVTSGRAANKATAMRMALEKYVADQAVLAVLEAQLEPTLHGDIDDLMQKI